MRATLALTFASMLLAAGNGPVLLAQTADETAALPVALTAGGTFTFAPETDISAVGLMATATVRVSSVVGLGLGLRTWWSAKGDERCSISGSLCFMSEETEVIAGIAQATITAPRAGWLFARVGLGLALVREQKVERGYDYFLEHRSWPLTLLIGFGVNLQMAPHLFVTPSLEVTNTFVADRTIAATPALEILLGVGLTVG